MKKKLAVLSISGGLDSTCLLLKLLSEGYEVRCYAFYYGQKHGVELQKLNQNISFFYEKGFPVELQIIDLYNCFSESQSSLHQNGEAIPEGHYADENMKSTVVENRNVIFSAIVYGKALSLAKKFNTNVEIYLGIHKGDSTCYPDCTPESYAACEHAFKISNWNSDKVSYKAPFVDLTKIEVLSEGLSAMKNSGLSLEDQERILKNTWSCYKGSDEKGNPCNKCGTCQEKNLALYCNGLEHLISGEDKDLYKETCKKEIEDYEKGR